MKKRENGQALVDFLLLLVVLIGIPLALIFRYDVQLRDVSARAVRAATGRTRCRHTVPQRKAAPSSPAEAKPATPAAAPAEKVKPATPAAAPAAPGR